MIWEVVTPDLKKDELGNELQLSGGVKPVACQKCKREFSSETKNNEVTEYVPFFQCECGFTNQSGEKLLFHLQEFENHKWTQTNKKRIIKIEKILVGVIPYVTKTIDGVEILCGDCNGKKS